ncbi:hypothetical protein ACNA06_12500 [Lysinibacillus sp. RSDA_15]|uniref:Uncharacterized protein n=3 Tax=Lysinibacillus TaxID=400634 RepID=B1HX04_LYSSC|nr:MULTISPECIES: hypothetical protein [Lysinibacillus]ACA39989.1 hypothetical protein Bsph_2436 [Lysinibacillus sphaericus C3-41]EWH34043.1 hypothetical protein P799_07620 [Lysinibacillus sphaericus CBAM5]MCS1394539.1 hypothetical protein [Lysinibacillus sp. PB211]MDR0157524.1 hypothetical protein [Lysinibacillus sphaericus]
MNAYKNVLKQIHASDEFKIKMQNEMMEFEQKEKRAFMKKVRISVGSLVACAVIAVAAPLVNVNNDTALDLTERIVVDHAAPAAKAVVNIEGKITEVGKDGLSFTLDNGMEVVVTDETKLGIDGPTAPPKEEQFFEPTFRVGNLIGGFTEDTTTDPVNAAVIYTNWNFDNPIR